MSDRALSVIVPTFNRREMLREMLLSLQDQTLPPDAFEVVVADDGSTDGTSGMLTELAGQVAYRLHVCTLQNGGPARARNRGAAAASAPTLVFLDDDLLPQPAFLEEHLRLLESDPSAVVLGRLVPWGRGARGGWNRWEERVYEKHYRAVQERRRPAAGRRLYSGNFSLWREPYLAAGGFDESLLRGEDVELGFRLEREGARFHFSPEAWAYHRGYRTYDSWRRSAYLYGRTDVQLAVQRGHRQVLNEILGWYYRGARPLRWVVSAGLRSRRLHAVMSAAFRLTAGMFDAVRIVRPAHYGYSAIYNLQYWQGVADELGGRVAFHAEAARRRPVPANAEPARSAPDTPGVPLAQPRGGRKGR